MAEGWGMAGWGGVLESGGGGGGGGPGPTVENFSPPDGTPIQQSTPLEFDVMAPNLMVTLLVSVIFDATGLAEVAYNGEGFSINYIPTAGFVGSERYGIPGGWHFILRRRGGWPYAPRVKVEGADEDGNPVVE